MWLFRTNETRSHRGWLFRLIKRGQVSATRPSGGQAKNLKPVSPAKTPKPASPAVDPKPVNVLLKGCPDYEDLTNSGMYIMM